MTSIEFIYQGNTIKVQSDLNDKLKDIINKYLSKSSLDKNALFFLYYGNIIDEELKLSELIKEDKNNTTKILVYSIHNIDNNLSLKKSKYIICPKCKENIKYKIQHC